jgi:putative ABC transport system ATP-binding protein
MLKGHVKTISGRTAAAPSQAKRCTVSARAEYLTYPVGRYSGHYVSVVNTRPRIGSRPSQHGGPTGRGAAVSLLGLVCEGSEPVGSAGAGVRLQVPPGQSLALVSQPARTASDLVDVIGAVQRPRSGQVFVDDVAIHRLRRTGLDRYRGSRGLLAARWPLLSSLSVTDNVLTALLPRRVDAAALARAAWLLSITGAADVAASPVDALTAEQQWRIQIARALAQDPKLVLAEDPTPHLDPSAATAVLDLLVEVHERLGFTLLIAVSRIATASRCQRLIRLRDGVIVEDDLIQGDDLWTRGRIDRIG